MKQGTTTVTIFDITKSIFAKANTESFLSELGACGSEGEAMLILRKFVDNSDEFKMWACEFAKTNGMDSDDFRLLHEDRAITAVAKRVLLKMQNVMGIF